MPVPREVAKLRQALDEFTKSAPRDLPNGVMESVKNMQQGLKAYGQEGGITPGMREAATVSGATEDYATGVDFRKAARGVDKPSPGQREVAAASQKTVSQEIDEAAGSIVERLRSERSGANSDGSRDPVAG